MARSSRPKRPSKDQQDLPLPTGIPPADRVLIGKLGRPHGVRGEVRLFTEDPQSGTPGEIQVMWIAHGDRFYRAQVKAASKSNRFWIMRLEGSKHRDVAARLTGSLVYVDREDLPQIKDDDTLYAHDLVGLRVLDPQGNEIGRVTDVFDNTAHDILVYRDENGVESMIPFVGEHVHEVDLDEETVTLEPLVYADPDRDD